MPICEMRQKFSHRLGEKGMPSAPQYSLIWRYCTSDGVPKRSLTVAIIGGTILNLINQGDVLFGAAHFNLTKLVLTFAVPYAVATYGAVSYRLRLDRERDSPRQDE